MNVTIKTIVLSFLVSSLMVLQAGAAEQTPKQVVSSTIQAIINVLEARADKTTIDEADREGIRKVVAGKFDYAEMARRSVGRPWNDMSKKEQASFTDLFRQVLEYSYGNQLSAYHGQKVEFDDAELRADKARVKGEVIDANKSTPMEYRLYQTPTGWQVYDIKIEGISMITTFRRDFKSILDDQGIAGLTATLKKKVERLKAQG